MIDKLNVLLSQLKPLRIGLYCIAIVFCVFAPAAGAPAIYEGIGVLQTLVLPSLVPLVFMVLLLDSLMNRVWMGDSEGDVRAAHKARMLVDLLVTTIVFVVWIPFFIAIW